MNPAFPAQVLFTDEAFFTRDGNFNSRNNHIWDDENPHAVFIRVHQARFNVNIWGGILGDYMLGSVTSLHVPDSGSFLFECPLYISTNIEQIDMILPPFERGIFEISYYHMSYICYLEGNVYIIV